MTNDMPVNTHLARFAADFADVWEEFCNRPEYNEFFGIFREVGVRLYTEDGLVAKFYEEGVAFYPSSE